MLIQVQEGDLSHLFRVYRSRPFHSLLAGLYEESEELPCKTACTRSAPHRLHVSTEGNGKKMGQARTALPPVHQAEPAPFDTRHGGWKGSTRPFNTSLIPVRV